MLTEFTIHHKLYRTQVYLAGQPASSVVLVRNNVVSLSVTFLISWNFPDKDRITHPDVRRVQTANLDEISNKIWVAIVVGVELQ